MNVFNPWWLTLAAYLLLQHSAAAAADDEVVVYPAFTAGNAILIEGRVVERKTHDAPTPEDGRRKNAWRAWELMVNDERKDYPVTVRLAKRSWRVTTDHEGYFRVDAKVETLESGWHEITAHTEQGDGKGRLLKLPADNTHGIISDVDDTILVTEVNSKRRMLANTFLSNALQRDVVPGIAEFYGRLASVNPRPDAAPIIFLSASPRQLHGSIEAFLKQNEFPPGVLITKRVTDDRTSEPLTDQVRYKTAKVEFILATWPNVTFTLIGDDGEYDPEIYADIQHRFPHRVSSILIRKVNPDPARTSLRGQRVLDEAIRGEAPR